MKIQNFIKSKKGIAAICVLLVLVLVIGIIYSQSNRTEEVTYRETKVQYGNLTVGITEDGTVDIGTVEQVFELDMSALQRTDTSSDSTSSSIEDTMRGIVLPGGGMTNSGGGGNNMFSQIFSMAGGTDYTTTGDDSSLEIAEVAVSVGQQVEVGDVLYYLEEESVAGLEEELQSNVEKARADLDAVYADQVLSKQTAEITYKSNAAYGSYAQTEYNTSIQNQQNTITEKQETLDKARISLNRYEEQLAQAATDYEEALVVLKNSEWSRDNTGKWNDTYSYVSYFQLAQNAQSNADTLETKKEQLEKNVEQAVQNVETCENELNAAKRTLESLKLSARQTYDLRVLAYDTAQENYDITLAYLEDEAAEQEKVYAETLEKWDEYSSHISDNAVLSKYSGVITSVDLAAGDSIATNSTLITLYDMEEVSMTVTVDESDMDDIALGTKANISFTAYPEDIFEASVTEIADAATDSYGNVTVDVTITMQGDVSGLFQGMTGEITFITRESKDVLYVSNRAVTREGTKSYVKVMDANGNITKQEITTGFSDGVNTEVVEGLKEGDVVLIESRVSE